MGCPVLLLAPEVEAGVDAQGAEGVGDRKVRLAVVVSVEHERGSREIFGSVIDDAGAGDEVEVDVLYPTFVLEVVVVDARFLEADAWKEREVGYPVLGEDPVVTIAEAEAVVGIFDVVEPQAGA